MGADVEERLKAFCRFSDEEAKKLTRHLLPGAAPLRILRKSSIDDIFDLYTDEPDVRSSPVAAPNAARSPPARPITRLNQQLDDEKLEEIEINKPSRAWAAVTLADLNNETANVLMHMNPLHRDVEAGSALLRQDIWDDDDTYEHVVMYMNPLHRDVKTGTVLLRSNGVFNGRLWE